MPKTKGEVNYYQEKLEVLDDRVSRFNIDNLDRPTKVEIDYGCHFFERKFRGVSEKNIRTMVSCALQDNMFEEEKVVIGVKSDEHKKGLVFAFTPTPKSKQIVGVVEVITVLEGESIFFKRNTDIVVDVKDIIEEYTFLREEVKKLNSNF